MNDSAAQDPVSWHNTGIGLKRSADIIWRSWWETIKRLDEAPTTVPGRVAADIYVLWPSFMLLFGLALENLLKGIIVTKNPASFSQKIRWSGKLKGGHNIVGLCEEAGISISDEEKRLLEELTESIIWRGRYPVPKNHKNTKDYVVPVGITFKQHDLNKMEGYKKACDNLFYKIAYALERTARIGFFS